MDAQFNKQMSGTLRLALVSWWRSHNNCNPNTVTTCKCIIKFRFNINLALQEAKGLNVIGYNLPCNLVLHDCFHAKT